MSIDAKRIIELVKGSPKAVLVLQGIKIFMEDENKKR